MSENLRVFHTADIHLGLTFGNHPDEVSRALSEARFETLERMVALANREKCQLFVVAGDLFDTTRVAKKAVVRAARILSAFEGTAVVLPGNHDYITGQPDEIWAQFAEAKGDRVYVLGRSEPVLIPGGICLYPAPCQSRHSKSHVMGWVTSVPRSAEARFHVGIAHGSFEALTPDLEGDYFPMKKDELLRCGLDLWLMGHIHLQYPVRIGSTDQIFYPGTPEPDGFDCRHEGKAWLIELGSDKRIQAQSHSMGKYQFQHHELRLQSLSDLDQWVQNIDLDSSARVLLKLKLSGSLPREEMEFFSERLKQIDSRFFRLITDYSELKTKLTPGETRKEFPDGSFALRLMEELSGVPEDEDALHLAHEMIRELREEAAGG